MQQRQLLAAMLALCLLLAGCSHNDTMNRPADSGARHQSDELANRIDAIVRAPDASAEADAIRKLHQYESGQGLTYTIQTIRTSDNRAIASASVGNQPVTANITIFQGSAVVRRFTYIPRDNANLALFGS